MTVRDVLRRAAGMLSRDGGGPWGAARLFRSMVFPWGGSAVPAGRDVHGPGGAAGGGLGRAGRAESVALLVRPRDARDVLRGYRGCVPGPDVPGPGEDWACVVTRPRGMPESASWSDAEVVVGDAEVIAFLVSCADAPVVFAPGTLGELSEYLVALGARGVRRRDEVALRAVAQESGTCRAATLFALGADGPACMDPDDVRPGRASEALRWLDACLRAEIGVAEEVEPT